MKCRRQPDGNPGDRGSMDVRKPRREGQGRDPGGL